MANSYNKSTQVQWDWGKGTATGKVVEVFTAKITKNIDGTDVTRKADDECPAYLIEQDNGSMVLKSHSEVTKV